ncbi:MAG: protein kinase [Myxococcales bacterium]|nr:protein kinase [Myxococcales bacterium]
MATTLLCPNFRCAHTGIALEQTHCPKCSTPLSLGQHYHLLRALSQGGMGSTYLAEDSRFRGSRSERCVIKEIKSEHHDKDFVAMLQREAGGLLQLRHTGIPAYRDFFEASPGGPPSRWFLVQEAIEGETLQAKLTEGEVFTLEEGIDIFRQVLEILQYLHELKDPETGRLAPVIHLDIKPDNLMRRSSDGRIFLIDFGVASQLQHTIQGSKGAKASVYGYTLGFAPFEQTLGYAAPSSDLYSLAMTLLVLLTGESPLALFDPIEQTARFHRYVSLPTPLALLVSRMLRVNMKERVASAREVLLCLNLALAAIEGDGKALQSLMDTLKLSQTLQGAILPDGSSVPHLANGAMESMVLAKAETVASSAQNATPSLESPSAASEFPALVVPSSLSQHPKMTGPSRFAVGILLLVVFSAGWLGSRLFSDLDRGGLERPYNRSLGKAPARETPSTKQPMPPSKKAPLYRPLTPPISSVLSPPVVRRESPSPTSAPIAPSPQIPVKRRAPVPAIPAQILEDLKPSYSLSVRSYALRSLSRLRTKASLQLLFEHLSDRQLRIRKVAAESLAQMGEPGIDTLIQALKLRDNKARRYAAEALGKIGSPARRALPLLLLALEEPVKDIRMTLSFLHAIRMLKPTPYEVWPPLHGMLRVSFSSDVRAAIAKVILELPIPKKVIFPDIQKDLTGKHHWFFRNALSLLEHLRGDGIGFLPLLQELLRDPKLPHGKRYPIFSAILHFGPKALPFWEEQYYGDTIAHQTAVGAFTKMKAASLPSLTRLFAAEKDANKREEIIRIAGYIGKDALPFLQKAAKDTEPSVQRAAERLLERLDTGNRP